MERAAGRSTQALSFLLPNARFSTGVAYDILNPANPVVAGGGGMGGVAGGTGGTRAPTVPVGTATLSLTQSVVDVSAWKGLSAADAARASAALSLEDVRRRATQGLARSLVAVIAAERVAELNRVGLRQALERFALIGRTQQLGAATQVDVVRTRQDVEVARGTLLAGDEQLRRTREALGVALGSRQRGGRAARLRAGGAGPRKRARSASPSTGKSAPISAASRANLESAGEPPPGELGLRAHPGGQQHRVRLTPPRPTSGGWPPGTSRRCSACPLGKGAFARAW